MRLADGRVVETDRVIAFPGWRYNAYSCPGPGGREAHIDHRSTENPMGRYVEAEHSHWLLSLDVDDGVTPFMVTCPDHDRTATSAMYRVDERLATIALPVRMVWRRATASETKRWKRKNPAMYEHVRLGGLVREWAPR